MQRVLPFAFCMDHGARCAVLPGNKVFEESLEPDGGPVDNDLRRALHDGA